MCKCGGTCASCADGTTTSGNELDPKMIADWINKYIFEGSGTSEQIQEAYVKARVWLDENKLEATENNIASNKDAIKVAINDPDYLKEKVDEETNTPVWKIYACVAGLILLGYWAFKQ